MALTRHKLVQGAAVAATVSAVPMKLAFGQSAAFTFKFADSLPPAHPLSAGSTEAAGTMVANDMVFNTPAIEPFRKTVRSAGLYTECKGKFGDEAWPVPERYAGKLG